MFLPSVLLENITIIRNIIIVSIVIMLILDSQEIFVYYKNLLTLKLLLLC